MAATNNLVIFKGSTVVLQFRHVIEGTTTPVDITGKTIVFSLKRRFSDAAALLSLSTLSAGPAKVTITDGPNGAYTVTLTPTETTRAAGVYVHDVQPTDAGTEDVWSIGTFKIDQEVRVA